MNFPNDTVRTCPKCRDAFKLLPLDEKRHQKVGLLDADGKCDTCGFDAKQDEDR